MPEENENQNTEQVVVEAENVEAVGNENNGENAEPKTVDDLPKWARDEIKKTRKEAANHRKAAEAAKAENERNEKIRKTLIEAGVLEPDDANAEKLDAEQFKKAQSEARNAKIELAVLKAANKADADPDGLLDSRSFMKSVSELDPTSEDFLSEVSDAVKEAVKANDRYKRTDAKKMPEKRSGGDHSAGAETARQLTEADLANMTRPQIVKAFEEGRLAHMQGII